MEELFQFIYLTPVGVLKFRSDGTIDMMNPVASALLIPIAPGGALGNIYTAMAPLLPDLSQQVASFSRDAGTIIDQHRLETRAGDKMLVLSLTVNRVHESVYMAVLEDVTKVAAQERKLFDDRAKFRAIFEHVRDYAIYTITLDGRVEEWNRSLERLGGWLPADVDGRSIDMFFAPDDPKQPSVDALLAQATRLGSVETEGWRRKRDGSQLWGNTVITALPDVTGAVRGFAVVSRDMTERKRLEDAVMLLATIDPLTGAYNRRQGDAFIAAEFSRRDRGGLPFAALMLDIDNFKLINDRFGHQAGDAVLRALVQTCKKTLRTSDILVRWGGEEFLMLLPGTDAAAAMAGAERVRAALAATSVVDAGDTPINFTVSIGVAVPANNDPEELLRRSDVALYAAKEAGRNRVALAE
jgi:diguanylate cyclase (GGDEF)-like protein/PAS domain S-box-containing protein